MDEVPYEFIQGGGYFGPDFTAVFFFEDIFWRMRMPVTYGAHMVDTLDCLVAMPMNFKQQLADDALIRKIYAGLPDLCILNFAPYSDRYTDNEYSRQRLWIAYQAAQFAGAALLRVLNRKDPTRLMHNPRQAPPLCNCRDLTPLSQSW